MQKHSRTQTPNPASHRSITPLLHYSITPTPGLCAFTLELLVVIAIIAILAAMLLPALGRAKENGWPWAWRSCCAHAGTLDCRRLCAGKIIEGKIILPQIILPKRKEPVTYWNRVPHA